MRGRTDANRFRIEFMINAAVPTPHRNHNNSPSSPGQRHYPLSATIVTVLHARQRLWTATAVFVFASALPVSAANWDGGDGTWSTSSNKWDASQPWTQGSAAVFGGT